MATIDEILKGDSTPALPVIENKQHGPDSTEFRSEFALDQPDAPENNAVAKGNAAPESEPIKPTGTPETPAEPTPAKVEAKPGDGKGAMPAPRKPPEVMPYAAYAEEKQKRKDWKEKAIRLEEQAIRAEERMKALERYVAQSQQQAPSAQSPGQQNGQPQPSGQAIDPISDPDGFARAVTQRAELGAIARNVNWSEARARQAHEDFDEVAAVFGQLAATNPELRRQALLHHDPAEFVYSTGKRAKSFLDIGDDPEAWRTAERERLRAEIRAEQPAQSAAPPSIPPPSLASARSAGSRSGPAWAGPTPLADIVDRR